MGCSALRIRCARRTLFLFLLPFLSCLQCQISPLALFLLNKEHTEKIPSVFEKCTSLGSAPFSFALLWLAGLFQNPSQFPFSIFPNINRKRTPKHIFLRPLFSQHKEDRRSRLQLVNGEWFCSSACTLVCLFSSLHTECCSSQGIG